jgi:hypothetical protein
MIDERLRATDDRAWAGSAALTTAGIDLAARRDGVGAAVAAASAARPWGGDAAGQAFDLRYRLVEQQVLDAWEHLAGYVESLGDAVGRLGPVP